MRTVSEMLHGLDLMPHPVFPKQEQREGRFEAHIVLMQASLFKIQLLDAVLAENRKGNPMITLTARVLGKSPIADELIREYFVLNNDYGVDKMARHAQVISDQLEQGRVLSVRDSAELLLSHEIQGLIMGAKLKPWNDLSQLSIVTLYPVNGDV